MIAQRSKVQFVIANSVNHSVLIGNTPRPPTRQIMSEGVRLANSFIRGTFNVSNQQVDALEYLFVLSKPVQVVFPSTVMENVFHSGSDVLVMRFLPSSKSLVARSSLSALAGLRNRYIVSCQAFQSSKLIITTALLLPLVMTRGVWSSTTSSIALARFCRAVV